MTAGLTLKTAITSNTHAHRTTKGTAPCIYKNQSEQTPLSLLASSKAPHPWLFFIQMSISATVPRWSGVLSMDYDRTFEERLLQLTFSVTAVPSQLNYSLEGRATFSLQWQGSHSGRSAYKGCICEILLADFQLAGVASRECAKYTPSP